MKTAPFEDILSSVPSEFKYSGNQRIIKVKSKCESILAFKPYTTESCEGNGANYS
jgi:hypothetical protein